MANENIGLLGRKVGMTQLFDEDGAIVPVTVIDAKDNKVVQVKNSETRDGYSAVQFGFGFQKESRTSKAKKGHFAKAGVEPTKVLREIRLNDADASKYTAGQVLQVEDVFSSGDTVDVTGTSKGRGFAGVIKKYHFAGFIRSHGTHEFFRHGGSIGTRLTPGHVLKGKKMPGQMGNKRVTAQNLKLVKIDNEKGLLFVRGGIPGAAGTLVMIRKAIKA